MEVREPSAKYLRSAGYVQTELGVLPTDWRIAEIGQIAETSSGTTPPRSQYDRYFNGGVHAWVKTLDLNNAHIRETDESVTDNAIEETSLRLFPEGSVLVAMYGGLRQIGRTGLLRLPAAVNQAITAIRPNPTVFCPEFLLFYLNHRVGYWQSVASSSRKDPNITGADVRAFKLPLPEINEQQKIAAALTDADLLIDSLEQLLTKKRQIKQGAMQELLTGRRRLLQDTRAWRQVPLGKLGRWSGGMTPSMARVDYWSPAEVPWLSSGDLKAAQLSESAKSVSNAAIRDGTTRVVPPKSVVLVMRSGILRKYLPVGITLKPMAINQDLKAIQPNDEVTAEFLLHALTFWGEGILATCLKSGTTVESIEFHWLKAFTIVLPPIPEQDAIAEALSAMDTEITALEAHLTKARALKQAMAQALLTGRIRLVEPSA